MRPIFITLTLLLHVTTGISLAWQGPPKSPDLEARRQRFERAAAMRGRFRDLKNPVNATYAKASLASLLCPYDKGLAGAIFVEAIRDLNSLPDGEFYEAGPTLASGSFAALTRYLLSHAGRCDASVLSAASNDSIRNRMEFARLNAPTNLSVAGDIADSNPERAAQLAAAAVAASDPERFDFEPLVTTLCKLRGHAPDLADDLFEEALEFAAEPSIPNPANLQELGRYLLTAPQLVDQPDTDGAQSSFDVDGAAIKNLTTTRHSADPDLIKAYLEASLDVLSNTGAAALNPAVAYAIAYELIPKAHELEPDLEQDLQKILPALMAAAGSAASQIQGQLTDTTERVAGGVEMDPKYRNDRFIAKFQSFWGAARFDQARDVALRVYDQTLRQQLTGLLAFGEATAALGRKDPELAVRLANTLPPSLKRLVVYLGLGSAGSDEMQGIEYLQMALKELEPLAAEQRVYFLLPVAQVMLRLKNPERAYTVLSQAVAAYNDALDKPRRQSFDPTSDKKMFNTEINGATDAALIMLTRRGARQVVDSGRSRRNFPLKVPGVEAFSLPVLIATFPPADMDRVEAIVLGLRHEARRVDALLAIASVLLKSR